MVNIDERVYALDNSGEDSSLQFASGTLVSATLSIDGESGASLSEQVLAAPGEVAYSKEHTVTVTANNIESYDLIISGSNTLSSSGTQITGANGESGKDLLTNTWGYAFGNGETDKAELSYYGLSSSGKRLNSSDNADMQIIGNSVNFSRKLVFAARFGEEADSGHYTGSASLSLIATPRTVGTWSTEVASGITTMQEMTPEICEQVGTPAASEVNAPTMLLHDTRDNNIYTIAKLADGNCWMTENLRLTGGKTLTTEDSDVEEEFVLPESLTELPNDFNGKIRTARSYYNPFTIETYGVYYNWYAATAGEILSAVNDATLDVGDNARTSICPKGWGLPSEEDFSTLQSIAQFSASVPPIAKPYNFTLTGYISESDNILYAGTRGYYWTSTTTEIVGEYNTPHVYVFSAGPVSMNSSSGSYTGRGRVMRCIAKSASRLEESAQANNDIED